MKQLLVFICLLTLVSWTSNAQLMEGEPNGFDINHEFSLSVAAGEGFLGSLSWTHFYGIGQKKNFKVGYGLRFNSYTGSDRYFTSAPTELATDDALVDTLFMSESASMGLNLTLNAKARLFKKLEAGFNIDLAGFSFGPEKTGQYISIDPTGITEFASEQTAKPTPGNLLLLGTNDIGMINSEFYLGYWLTDKLNLRAGMNYLFTEYTTNNELHNENDRFRDYPLMPFIAINFSSKRN